MLMLAIASLLMLGGFCRRFAFVEAGESLLLGWLGTALFMSFIMISVTRIVRRRRVSCRHGNLAPTTSSND